jgi:hypothetical protein
LLEEDASPADIRGFNLADRFTIWTGPTLNAWFSGSL